MRASPEPSRGQSEGRLSVSERFAAPWSPLLQLISAGVGALLVIISLLLARAGSPLPFPLLPLIALVGSLFFVVRGYRLTGSDLFVRRLIWSNRVSLVGLKRAWASPTAMRLSLRLFGNGGLFSISGLFRSSELGRYRAFATDPRSAVVLELPEHKVVVTPADPADFLRSLAAAGFEEAVATGAPVEPS